MACFHPLEAFRTRGGDITFRRGEGVGFTLKLPCGRCVGCKIDRTKMWAVRNVHEASLHAQSSFLTLTYAPEHLPTGETLVKKHFQDFIKRYRKSYGEIRYYMCGEYGGTDQIIGRPHYHALIFGHQFEDQKVWKRTKGIPIYTSEALTALWGLGHCTLGAISFQSAAYVARYILKKITGDLAQNHYIHIDEFTGECTNRLPEYTNMSLKPGIGARWFEKYHSDIYPEDELILGGKRYKSPAHYDILFKRLQGEDALVKIKNRRVRKARKNYKDNTPDRLKVRETILKSKISRLHRELHDDS